MKVARLSARTFVRIVLGTALAGFGAGSCASGDEESGVTRSATA